MRLRYTAALGLSAGALVLSGGLAMADSSSGGERPTDSSAGTDILMPADSGTATATTRAFPGERGLTGAGGSGYGFATAAPGGEISSFSVEGDGGPGDGRTRRMVVDGHELSDSQRECMERNGAAPPAFEDQPTREDMEAHREKIEAAMDECGVEHAKPGRPGAAANSEGPMTERRGEALEGDVVCGTGPGGEARAVPGEPGGPMTREFHGEARPAPGFAGGGPESGTVTVPATPQGA